jgi:hypothetical protein
VYRITIPCSVTSIDVGAFEECESLTTVTIPGRATNLEVDAFFDCTSLTNVYFTGNAPPITASAAFGSSFTVYNPTIYYLPGASGWDYFSVNVGWLVELWNPLIQTGDGSFGINSSNQFGFNITATNNFTVVVEACTNLAGSAWTPLQTVTLTNGTFYFSDPGWTNYPGRFYGLGFP